MNVTFQVSIYPIGRPDFKGPIDKFIMDLRKDNVHIRVHETSTVGEGEVNRIFDSLKKAYTSAAGSGDTVMVLTIVNGAPTREELDRLNG